jgi:hypothetical protein
MRDVVEKLLTTGSFTKEDFFYLYRILCKNTHPDLTGKDGADFIRLQEIYQQVKNDLETREVTSDSTFDPYRVITESGYSRSVDVRTALYISLTRYVALGLHSYRVRSRILLKERNRNVIRTILYWANRYDKRFVPIFIRYNENKFENAYIGERLKQGIRGKRMFIEGLKWFVKYQENGRESAAHIAGERLSSARAILEAYGTGPSPTIEFAHWLLGELHEEPVGFNAVHPVS